MCFFRFLLCIFILLIGSYSLSTERDNLHEVMRRYKELGEAREIYKQSVDNLISPQERRDLSKYWQEEREQTDQIQQNNKKARTRLVETLKNYVEEQEVFSLMVTLENYIYYRRFIDLIYDEYSGYEFPITLDMEYDEVNLLVQFFSKYFPDKKELKNILLNTFQHLADTLPPRVQMHELKELEKRLGYLRMRQVLYRYRLTDSAFVNACENSFDGGSGGRGQM